MTSEINYVFDQTVYTVRTTALNHHDISLETKSRLCQYGTETEHTKLNILQFLSVC